MGFLKSNGMLVCERRIFSGIMISATTLFYFGKYSYNQIKLANPKLLLSHNIMSHHHYRMIALNKDNTHGPSQDSPELKVESLLAMRS